MIEIIISVSSDLNDMISYVHQTLDLLARLCSSHGYGALRLDGSTPSSKRQAIVDQFNSKHGRERTFTKYPTLSISERLYKFKKFWWLLFEHF